MTSWVVKEWEVESNVSCCANLKAITVQFIVLIKKKIKAVTPCDLIYCEALNDTQMCENEGKLFRLQMRLQSQSTLQRDLRTSPEAQRRGRSIWM